jgi:hypothetical protein
VAKAEHSDQVVDKSGLDSWQRQNFSFPDAAPQPSALFSSKAHKPPRETDHSPPYGDEINNALSYTPTPPRRLRVVHD